VTSGFRSNDAIVAFNPGDGAFIKGRRIISDGKEAARRQASA
jgi:hypothetical protein